MRIINPLYDHAFKYLMDNEHLVKKVLEVILEKEVLSVESIPTKQTLLDKRTEIPHPRFYFKAIIRSPETGEQVVLIEIQKSKTPDPFIRFRRSLRENYILTESFIDEQGREVQKPLPIITIHILGYNIPEFDSPGILVHNTVIDATTKQTIPHKKEFVQFITDPCYILQIQRLKPDRKTKLEKFLSFFDQNLRTDDDFILEIEEQDVEPEFSDIARHLNLASQDENMIEKLWAEKDLKNAFDKRKKNI